jgi:quercetin dioxygenase-like cupin family protein
MMIPRSARHPEDPMKIVRAPQFEEVANPHGVSVRHLHDSPHVQVSQIVLTPGQELKRHVTPVDAFVYVLEGRGRVEVGEESAEAEAGALVDFPQQVPHAVRNEGTEVLRFLVVKTPKPVAAGKLG